MRTKRSRWCGHKRRFRDKRQALHIIRNILKFSLRAEKPNRAYYCWKCLGWHITKEIKHGRESSM